MIDLLLFHTALQLALGSILRDISGRNMPCGVFGSFGWSGEAVDEMEVKLKDGGYAFAFKPIRVKFKPTATVSMPSHNSQLLFSLHQLAASGIHS